MLTAPSAVASHWRPIALFVAALTILMALTLAPYGGNPSSLFHIDRTIGPVIPPHTVVLSVPAYDGMQYFQVAYSIPSMFSPSAWKEKLVDAQPTGVYAYQRFLLPLSAFILASGQESLFQYTFLLINLAALLGTFLLILRRPQTHSLYAFALALSPAATIGLHFSLAEPLTLFLLTAFLLRFVERKRIDPLDVLLLSAAVLSREVNILFVGFTLLWLLWKKQWRDAALLLIPIAVFVGLQLWIMAIFGQIPFFMSTAKHGFPFIAPLQLLVNVHQYNRYTLSAIALLLLFVLPTLVQVLLDMQKSKDHIPDTKLSFIHLLLLAFLLIMLTTPSYIWGSITSIGRAITPVYPLFIVGAMMHDRLAHRLIAGSILLLGLGAGIGLAFSVHPFAFSPLA